MASIHKTIPAHCPKCDTDVEFEINMRLVDYNGIIPCLRCPRCNVECPAYSFSEFLNTGKIIIGV